MLPFDHPLNQLPAQNWLMLLTIIICAGILWLVLGWFQRRLSSPASSLGTGLGITRAILIPFGALLFALMQVFNLSAQNPSVRIIETIIWIGVIWLIVSLFRIIFFQRAAGVSWRANVPTLFLDILQVSLIALGAGLVIAGVWDKNLGSFFATLGIGSIVLGLALQDTLGNLMAGIALLFERPFGEGEWIRVGGAAGILGEVVQMNWRAVHLLTRSRDLVIVPNSVLGKEKIENFSRPSRVHGTFFYISFAYRDPPNQVKQMLKETALQTRGILPNPEPHVRTKEFTESAVRYEVKAYIDRFDRLPEIEEEFLTHVWYARRRHKLHVPFPVRVVQKTEVPPLPEPDDSQIIRETLSSNSLFKPLSESNLILLAKGAELVSFADGERILTAGEVGEDMFIIRYGRVNVSLPGTSGAESMIAQLSDGEYFGEMGVLTGDPRSAHVTALQDVELVKISKAGLRAVLSQYPELANHMAEVIETRRQGLNKVLNLRPDSPPPQNQSQSETKNLVSRMKRFLGLN